MDENMIEQEKKEEILIKNDSEKDFGKLEEITEENIEKVKTCKEKFDAILDKINKMTEAIELHNQVKEAVSKEEVDYNYLRYIENSLEEKIFDKFDTKGIMPKVLLETVCMDLKEIENFESDKLQIENIGSHFEEQENYIDKICIYNNELISVFGINEMHPDKVLKYEPRKFSRSDMIDVVKLKYEEGESVLLYQYDEYYIGVQKDRIKVFSERKTTALVKIEETIFDKIKSKLINLFTKKKIYPDLELVYDSNSNRLKEIKTKSKFDAKSRIKLLLNKEREITRA